MAPSAARRGHGGSRGRQAPEISEQTYHRWRNQYGRLKADDAKHLKELSNENNTRLKRIVADKELENRWATGVREGKLLSWRAGGVRS